MQTILRPTYARRYHKLIDAITTYLWPLGIHEPPPDRSGTAGGYYVWLQFPAETDAQRVSHVAAEKYNLLLHPGEIFLVEGDASECQKAFLNGVRVCFAWAEENLLAEGIKRLATIVTDMEGSWRE